jgi:hypothetical protein
MAIGDHPTLVFGNLTINQRTSYRWVEDLQVAEYNRHHPVTLLPEPEFSLDEIEKAKEVLDNL